VVQAVVHEPAGGVRDETLWSDNERLRAGNEALWAAWRAAEPLPEVKQQECAATGSAMGWSVGHILLLWAIGLPQGRVPRRATVGRWVAQASRHARGLWAILDPCGQRGVLVLCWAAIVCHREPSLMAVAPPSRAWVAGQRGPDRSGERGCALVAKWPCVARVLAEAGQGLERGVQLAKKARAAEAHAPATATPIAMGREVLHPQRERQRVVPGPWRRAERL
jgi:hypothetical protein